MPSTPITNFTKWSRLEGQVAGEYRLRECLGESGNAGLFRTAYGPGAEPALLKLVPTHDDPEPQLELWKHVQRLSHPHLLRLLDCGCDEVDGDQSLYAVYELPDDTLATALQHSSLSGDETSDVREAVSQALRSVHSQGLVHTSVDAEHIVAIGNQIKLSSDTLCEPSTGYKTEEDFRQLDRFLPVPAPTPAPAAAPAPAAVQEKLVEAPAPIEPAGPRTIPLWAYVGLAVVLGFLAYLFVPKSQPASQPQPTPVAPSPAPPVQKIAPPAQRSMEPQPAASTRELWRVVAFTYRSEAKAAQRAVAINKKWPDAKAEVFTPTPGRSPYLVAIGGRMNRDEAVTFLKIARGKGLPRDTYIQNYSH